MRMAPEERDPFEVFAEQMTEVMDQCMSRYLALGTDRMRRDGFTQTADALDQLLGAQ